MRVPDRIVGFLILETQKVPFELDKEKLELKLYYSTESDAYRHLFCEFEVWGNRSKERHWVDDIVIEGKTAEGYSVYFGTQNNPKSYHGYRTYTINWYYITDSDFEEVDELRFSGREVDAFFDPNRTFVHKVKYEDENSTIVNFMDVHTVKNVDFECGQYYSEGVQFEVLCSAYAKIEFSSERPLSAQSCLKLRFAEVKDIDILVKQVKNIKQFICYVCYRTNCRFEKIATYITTDEGRKRECGRFVFRDRYDKEDNLDIKNRIIKAECLGNKTADIIGLIDKSELTFGHYCESLGMQSVYHTSRMIMILAAFEREFRNSYGQDVIRSDNYKEVKAEIINLINEHVDEFGGAKKYVKEIVRGITNFDSSYGDNVKYAFKDCRSIIKPFVKRRYAAEFEKVIEEVGIRINTLRNGIAHCRLDLELEPKHIDDIHCMEEMLYVMRLKKIGVEDTNIQKAVSALFNEKLF